MTGRMMLQEKQLLAMAQQVAVLEANGRPSEIVTPEIAADLIARITFSVITEPGDKFAGWLVRRFEPVDVVEALQQGFNFTSLLSRQDRGELEQRFGDVERLLKDATERWKPRFTLTAVESAIKTASLLGAKVLAPESAYWPAGLGLLGEGSPHCLWLRGNPRVLAVADRSLSIVGSRLASNYGERVTTELVSAAVAENLSVISGGAYGIDAIAHRATLALDGFTVAVMAGGIDRLYPAGNFELLNEIAKSNLLVSEQAPGASPTKWRFLQRNRLIAALGCATIVVEAGIRSGALNTVNHATAIGRPVGVVPGRIDSPQSAGCNELLRTRSTMTEEVTLIASPAQAIELALGIDGIAPEAEELRLTEFEKRVLDALTTRGLDETRVATKAGLTLAELQIGLGGLELKGLITRVTKGWVKVD